MRPIACQFLALAGFAAGTHASSDDARLQSRLALKPQFSVLHVDAPTDAVFALRNTSTTPIEFCLVDGGVNLEVRGRDGLMRPLVVYTAVLHAQCHGRQRLAPGESAILRQVVEAQIGDLELPGDSVQMKACLRVQWPDREVPEAEDYLCSSEFKVAVRP